MLLEEWNKKLIQQSKKLIRNSYYMVDTAMEKIWDRNYSNIICDDEVEVEDVRSLFWNEGYDELEIFSNEIIDRYEEKYGL